MSISIQNFLSFSGLFFKTSHLSLFVESLQKCVKENFTVIKTLRSHQLSISNDLHKNNRFTNIFP